jgi:hypothetical protein
MGTMIENLYDHEGYAARKLPDGTLTARWTTDTAEFTAYVAACECARNDGWDHDDWYGTTEHPPTEEGEDAALAEWERVHARPLLRDTAPLGLDEYVTELLDRLRVLTEQRPVGVLATLRRIERATDDLLVDAVHNARQAGKSWSEIGAPLSMSRQAAQQRFGR